MVGFENKDHFMAIHHVHETSDKIKKTFLFIDYSIYGWKKEEGNTHTLIQ